MGAVVFDNYVFDAWLTKKSDEILSKVDRETISTEEMLTLILKAQTNHFHHVDVEFREEFRKINSTLEEHSRNFNEIDAKFAQIGDQFRQIDGKFDKIWGFQKWQAGMLFAAFGGLYLKLFLG